MSKGITYRGLIELLKTNEDMLDEEVDELCWYSISKMNLSKEFILMYPEELEWEYVLNNKDNPIDEELLEKVIAINPDYINCDWSLIADNFVISEEFVEKYMQYFDMEMVGQYGVSIFSEDFLIKHKDKLAWYYILESRDLSVEFLNKHKDFIFWDSYYSHNQHLTIEKIKQLECYEHIKNIQNNTWISSEQKQLILDYLENKDLL